MNKLKVIFMGTPDFAVSILNALVKVYDVVLVVTQPDKIVGRNHKIEFSPVKKRALELGIEIFQPQNIRHDNDKIFSKEVDIIVTAAYGQIVGTKVLYYPKYHSINVHGSLLPKYRGGSPIQRAIMNGDTETGITIMYMEKGMDSGDILEQEKIIIENNDTSTTLFDKLASLGATMITKTIEKIVNNEITPIKQNENEVTYAPIIQKEEEKIDFNTSAFSINCMIRALANNPGAYFLIDGVHYKVYSSIIEEKNYNEVGKIVNVNKNSFTVSCKKGCITFTEIKPEGKNLMKVSDFLNGKGKSILLIDKYLNN